MERRHFVDGMRGWACLMVFYSHTLKFFLIGVTPAYASPWLKFISDGQLAVYIFFVLSGFALSTGYFQSRDTRKVAALAIRRYPRLAIPILCGSAAAYLVMKAGLMYNLQAAPLLHSDWTATMYNFEPSLKTLLSFGLYDVFFSYWKTTHYVPVLWTMPIEFFGSLTVFCVLFVSHYTYRRMYLYGAVMLVLVVMKSNMLPFLFGIMLADGFESKALQEFRRSSMALPTAVILLGIGIVCSTFERWIYRDGSVGISAVALCIVAAAFFSARFASVFENRLSQFMGRISFPLFITHIIVLFSPVSFLIVYLNERGIEWNLGVANGIVLFATALAIGVATLFEPIERFAINSARELSRVTMRPKTS